MKQNIHPTYNLATITCACGATFQTRTTVGDLKVDICAVCHPFYTGKQKLVDTAGRVEKYRRKFEKSRQMAGQKQQRKQAVAESGTNESAQ